MSSSKHVLVTGSAGRIGMVVCSALSDAGHVVRGLDLVESEGIAESIAGNITDPATLDRAMSGMDTVIHLAAQPNESDFHAELLPKNIVGVYEVFEAAVRCGVERLVFASSCQVVNAHMRPGHTIRLEDGPGVTNHYGALKHWGEQLGDMYFRRHGLSVLSVRIGWYPRFKRELKSIEASEVAPGIFLSHDDAARFFCRAVEADWTGSAVVFASSLCPEGQILDPEPARRLIGYEPKDSFPDGLSDRVVGDEAL